MSAGRLQRLIPALREDSAHGKKVYDIFHGICKRASVKMNVGAEPDIAGMENGHAQALLPPQHGHELPKSGWIVATLIGIGAVLGILSYFYSDNAGGHAWARVALTALWLIHPKFQIIFQIGTGSLWEHGGAPIASSLQFLQSPHRKMKKISAR